MKYKYLKMTVRALRSGCIKGRLRLTHFALRQPGTRPLLPGEKEVVVTLTSYGRRAVDLLPYTLHSLLSQRVKPHRVVLWLDSDHFSDTSLPAAIRRFLPYGLEIRYCRDIRSYKKLMPALEAFPDALLITADDDFYYSPRFVGTLTEAYAREPRRLHAWRGNRPRFAPDGALLPYRQWDIETSATTSTPIFPTSGGGVAWTRQLLHPDVTREELYLSLCPTADDVWLYVMTVLQRTPVSVIGGEFGTPLDTFYRHRAGRSGLKAVNVGEGMNDVQITRAMQHYSLAPSDLVY